MLGNLPFALRGPEYYQLAQNPIYNPAAPSALPFMGPGPSGLAPSGYQPSPETYGTGNTALGLVEIPAAQRFEVEAPLEISLEVTSSTQLVSQAPGLRLCGFSAKETGGSPATAVIRRGNGTGSPVLLHLNLSASGTAGDVWPVGLRASEGVYFDLLTGAMNFVAYYKTVAER